MKTYKYDYPENREALLNVRSGDSTLIHEITGFSISYVNNVINGKRNNKEIIRVAKNIIKKREKIKTEYNPK